MLWPGKECAFNLSLVVLAWIGNMIFFPLLHREHAPSIIFMDEIDSIGSSRIESGGSGLS